MKIGDQTPDFRRMTVSELLAWLSESQRKTAETLKECRDRLKALGAK